MGNDGGSFQGNYKSVILRINAYIHSHIFLHSHAVANLIFFHVWIARSDLVKEKAKEIKIDNNITAKFRAKLCCLSKTRLKRPIAACKAGNLYNKEEVIKALMEKSIPLSFAHIKRIKDIKEVKLESNPDKKSEYPFICPLS